MPKALGRRKWGGIIVDKSCFCVIFVPTENKKDKKMPNEIIIDLPDCVVCGYGTPGWVLNQYIHEQKTK